MFHGIRFRLFLAALVLLAIPWLAAQFIATMERFLREEQVKSISSTARAVATALSNRQGLFDRGLADDPEAEERRRIVALFAADDANAAASLGNAYVPSHEVESLLTVMGREASRLWVVDGRSRVRGLSGSLRDARAAPPTARWLRPIAALVVPTPRVPVGDVSQPVREQIDRALIGVTTTHLRGTVDRDVAILSAAQPIFVGDDIVGAVVVEETTSTIQLLKNRAVNNLLAVTLAIVAGALAVLLGFAGRLAGRVRRLHREAEAAIDRDGRVRGAIRPTRARDEIGDLARTMAAMLARLRDYNAYLEGMAGRLTHELRTPVAVVRSSLDNLKAQPLPAEARVYLERAGEGVERLARLIARLSEATRLEKMLESAERERFDLAALVAGCVEGYRAAYPDRRFELQRPEGALAMTGVPDAFAQLLDKLVENAHDFAPAGTPIRVRVEAAGRRARLAVENDGAPLPEEMVARIFDSMVSVREGEPHGAHLGLGLFVVKLVALAHGGSVDARNLTPEGGVRFGVEVPLG